MKQLVRFIRRLWSTLADMDSRTAVRGTERPTRK